MVMLVFSMNRGSSARKQRNPPSYKDHEVITLHMKAASYNKYLVNEFSFYHAGIGVWSRERIDESNCIFDK